MIRWPDRYDPARAPVHVRNEIDVAAVPDAVWTWLVRAPLWPTWYPNAKNVVVAGGSSELALGVSFTWRTFGVPRRLEIVSEAHGLINDPVTWRPVSIDFPAKTGP